MNVLKMPDDILGIIDDILLKEHFKDLMRYYLWEWRTNIMFRRLFYIFLSVLVIPVPVLRDTSMYNVYYPFLFELRNGTKK